MRRASILVSGILYGGWRKVSILLLGTLLGCSGKTLDNDTAAEEITKYFSSRHIDFFLEVGRVGKDCVLVMPDGTETPIDLAPPGSMKLLAAEAGGYVSIAPDGNNFWKVALTEKGKAVLDGRFNQEPPRKGCDYQSTWVLIARPELVKITGVTADENTPVVQYQWKWNATEFGRQLRQDGKAFNGLKPDQRADLARLLDAGGLTLPLPVPPETEINRSSVRFRKYTDGWRME
jgi:hypothetical protein